MTMKENSPYHSKDITKMLLLEFKPTVLSIIESAQTIIINERL